MKHVKQADSNLVNGYFPIHGMTLLDALLAFLDRDDRRVIIYAAMSVELIAEKKIYEAGEKSRFSSAVASKQFMGDSSENVTEHELVLA